MKLPESLFAAQTIRGLAAAQDWTEISKYIAMQQPPCSHSVIGELLIDAGNRELALEAFMKVSNEFKRVEHLLDYDFLAEAIEEMCQEKLCDYYETYLLDKARADGLKWVQGELNRKKEKYNLR